MAQSCKTLTIELMHQKLNVCFKILQGKKEEAQEDRKTFAAIKKQVEGKVLAIWNNQKFKGTCKKCGKYGNKVEHCSEKKSEEKLIIQMQINNVYCGKVKNRINEYCNKNL